MINFLFPTWLTNSVVARLLLAALVGGVIGLERDVRGRDAGLRTHILVSLGSALFMLMSQSAVAFLRTGTNGTANADPGRIAAGIVTGIGFIGAGAIIKQGFSIRGLTTAACLWVTAAIGMAAGSGFFELSIIVTLISLVTLFFLNRLEWTYAKNSYRFLEIRLPLEVDISRLIDTVKRKNLHIMYCDHEKDYVNKQMTVTFTVRLFHRGVTDKHAHAIIRDLETSGLPLQYARWSHS